MQHWSDLPHGMVDTLSMVFELIVVDVLARSLVILGS